jgi:hypothetical protein
MKLSTIAAALLLSNASAAQVGRMRKEKIYSSTPQGNVEFGRDAVVDPYLGLPDERGQRGLSSMSMSSMPPVKSYTDQSMSMSMTYTIAGAQTDTIAGAQTASNSAMTTTSVVAVVSAIAGIVALV